MSYQMTAETPAQFMPVTTIPDFYHLNDMVNTSINLAQQWLMTYFEEVNIQTRINSTGLSGGAYKDKENGFDIEYGIRVVIDPVSQKIIFGGSFSFYPWEYEEIRETVPHTHITNLKGSKLFMVHGPDYPTLEEAGKWINKWRSKKSKKK
jgi:hypothetical protein